MTDDDKLAFDLGHALRRSGLLRKGTPAERDQQAGAAAQHIVAHLRMFGWRFEKAPPAPAHSTHDNRPPATRAGTLMPTPEAEAERATFLEKGPDRPDPCDR